MKKYITLLMSEKQILEDRMLEEFALGGTDFKNTVLCRLIDLKISVIDFKIELIKYFIR